MLVQGCAVVQAFIYWLLTTYAGLQSQRIVWEMFGVHAVKSSAHSFWVSHQKWCVTVVLIPVIANFLIFVGILPFPFFLPSFLPLIACI